MLLLKYSSRSPEAGKWDLPGGHLEEGERWDEGLTREVAEETALALTDISPIRVFNTKTAYVCFFAASCTDHSVRLSEEHDECKWVSLEELSGLDLVRDNVNVDVTLAFSALNLL